MTDLLQFTITIRKSQRQPQGTLKHVCEDSFFFVSVNIQVSLCGHKHPKCEQAIRLVCPPFFCKLPTLSNPHKQKFNVVRP